MKEEDVETAIKVVVVGNGAVGKSSMIQRYCKGIFTKDYKKTIGVDFLEKQISCNGEDVRLMLWDTAGQEEFDSITKSYYRGAQACVLAFSTVDRASFEAVSGWKDKVHKECGDIAMVLVQNKIDLVDDAVLTPDEAEGLAKRLKLRFYRTSVKEDLNVGEVFQYLTERYIARKNAEDVVPPTQMQQANMNMFQSPGGTTGTIGNMNARSSSKKGKNKNQTVSLDKPNVQRTHGKKKKLCFNV